SVRAAAFILIHSFATRRSSDLYRKSRLQLNRASLRADMLKERVSGTGLEFDHLMQADVFCFLRSAMLKLSTSHWWPETLVYWSRSVEHTSELQSRENLVCCLLL